ncbi:hypothetical protein [Teredinibacter purpureus]|uniref:hypothetical protein n=1 Tax=Teredinibacter purpureus TaxID=2731756 RepID=UPI0005F7A4E1|nr:hypothetical protein [Teredinibacter purpureus]
MKKYLLLSIWFIGASCFATEQIKDVLSVGEARYSIRELPLNQLYGHDKLSSILNQELCSASWRGYKARWELKDSFLWLRGLEKNPCSNGYEPVEAKLLFGGQEYPIKAEWFTGKIVLPVGETKYVMREGFDENDMKDGDLLGYDLEAFVFNFVDGKLNSKGVELIQKRY